MCPSCRCDDLCINRGDCCPDLFFSFPPLSCTNRTVIEARLDRDRSQQSKRLMVSTCPEDATTDIASKCKSQDIKFNLQYQPVRDIDRPIVYKNRFCAACYNTSNFTQLGIDISCREEADFNFLSTWNEVIDLAIAKKCIIQATDEYNTEQGEINTEICLEAPDKVSKCNISWTWTLYDQDVESACESAFQGEHRIFKNIFCFMCNPPPQAETAFLIQCNKSTFWNPFDNGLEIMCRSMSRSLSTFPFKNIFCYLCNRDNDRTEIFQEVIGTVTEALALKREHRTTLYYQYNINITSINPEYLFNYMNVKLEEDPSLDDVITAKDPNGLISREGYSINITNLFNQYVSTFNEIGLCPSRKNAVDQIFLRDCDCAPFCVFSYSGTPCCMDSILDLSTTCREEQDLSGIPDPRRYKQDYLVINGCFQEYSRRIFVDGCINRKMDDILTILPLDIDINMGYSNVSVSYDNINCAICNMYSKEYAEKLERNNISLSAPINLTAEKEVENFLTERARTPWSLELICPYVLPIGYTVALGDLIRFGHDAKCRIRYVTDMKRSSKCFDSSQYFDCKMISDWIFPDNDVQWACQNHSSLPKFVSGGIQSRQPQTFDPNNYTNYRSDFRIYRNQFCSICKPNFPFRDVFISHCNVTGLIIGDDLDENFDEHDSLCKMVGAVYYFYPFKNTFCSMCNGMERLQLIVGYRRDKILPYQRIPGLNWFPILRNMFSISQSSFIEDAVTGMKCPNTQVYDQKEERCRNILCFPGKNLIKSGCLPLFKTTKMLRYTMSIGGSVDIKSKYNSSSSLLLHVVKDVQSLLTEKLAIKDMQHEHTYAYIEQPCLSPVDDLIETNIEIFLVIFVLEAVQRRFIERTLFQVMKSSCFQNNSLRLYPHMKSEKLPLLLYSYIPSGECIIHLKNSSKSDEFRPVPVSNVLLCPHIALDKAEYFQGNEETIFLTRNKKSLRKGEFHLRRNKKLLVCKEELERVGFFKKSDSSDLKILWYISLTCTSFSCVCLLITITTYCLFSTLRTTPGILNVVTMTTLLFTLTFHQLGMFLTVNDIGCAVLGACLHFTWLCVFMILLSCNFHMNRVFHSMSATNQKASRKTIGIYVTISASVSFVLVSVNLVHAFATSNGSSFGYGGVKCFIENTNMLIFTFIGPVLFMLLLSIILFMFSSRKILNTPQVKSNRGKRNDFQIILRMSSVTGICWITQIIDSFLSLSAFSFISTILNCSQGVLIFFAFTVNERVLEMYRAKFGSRLLSHNSENNLDSRS